MTTANLFRSAAMALALLAGTGMVTQVSAREHQRPEKIEKVEKVQKTEKTKKADTSRDKQGHDKGDKSKETENSGSRR